MQKCNLDLDGNRNIFAVNSFVSHREKKEEEPPPPVDERTHKEMLIQPIFLTTFSKMNIV